VLLLHGLGGAPAEMHPLGRVLARAGFPVEAIVLPGHCRTEADLLSVGWRDWQAAVEAAHDRLAAQYGRVLVAGLCLGALLALRLAARRPATVAGVVVCSTPLRLDGWALPRLAPLFLPLLLALPVFGYYWRFVAAEPFGVKDPRLRRHLAERKRRGEVTKVGTMAIRGGALRELAALTRRVRRDLPDIVAPALIVHACEDDIASPANTTLLSRALGGAARIVLLDDCYHMVTLDRQRHRLSAEVLAFFAALDGSA
jgi:carboxylesterase